MIKRFNNFLKLQDGEQIFYSTNFDPREPKEGVLIFNYGLVCSNHHWKFQLEHFDAQGYPILIHDYRGHYQSSGAADYAKITFRQITHDLKELIDHLQLKNSVLLGHSMGVNICLEYVRLFPADIARMVLISGTLFPVYNVMLNTHITGPLQPIIRDFKKKYPEPFDLFWKYLGWNSVVRKLVHQGGFHAETVSAEFVQIYLSKISQLGPEIFFQLLDQMHEHDVLSFVERVKTPCLIVGGNRDKVIPNFLQRLLHEKLKDSELYIIHEGSHVPQADFPHLLNERVENFI